MNPEFRNFKDRKHQCAVGRLNLIEYGKLKLDIGLVRLVIGLPHNPGDMDYTIKDQTRAHFMTFKVGETLT
jgi:hypothetical protein